MHYRPLAEKSDAQEIANAFKALDASQWPNAIFLNLICIKNFCLKMEAAVLILHGE